MSSLTLKPKSFKSFFHHLDLQICDFLLNRCDERTFYVTICMQFKGHKATCDLIYLIDKEDLYGAISLNSKYDEARKFISQVFDYELLYGDELFIAESIRNTPTFKQYLKIYADKYPKYIQDKFFK